MVLVFVASKIKKIKMRKIKYLILLLIPFGGFGQSNENNQASKIDIGYTFSPEYSYRFLKSTSKDQWIVDNYDTLEFSKFGYSLGINGVFNLYSNLSISSGVIFANKGDQTKKELSPSLNNYQNNYYYIDIPIKANYYLLHEKFKLYFSGGFSVNLFLNHSIISKDIKSNDIYRITDNSSLSKINLGINTGVGFDVNLTDKWYFKMECLYKQSIISIGNTPVKKYLYSIGPNLGFYFHL